MVTLWPATEARLMMCPVRCRANTGNAAATPYSTPLMLTSTIWSHSSTSVLSRGASAIKPALFTSTSIRPKRAIAPRTKASTSARLVTSTAIAPAFPPAALDIADDGVEALLAARPKEDLGSPGGQMAGGGLSQPAARSGDDNDLSFDVRHGCSRSWPALWPGVDEPNLGRHGSRRNPYDMHGPSSKTSRCRRRHRARR